MIQRNPAESMFIRDENCMFLADEIKSFRPPGFANSYRSGRCVQARFGQKDLKQFYRK
jgi:hypothetical protein